MRRRRWIPLGLLVLLAGGLAACAGVPGPAQPGAEQAPYPPPGFTHQRTTTDIEVFWNCTRPTPQALVLQGLAFNLMQPEVRSLAFTVIGVNARGRTVAEARDVLTNVVLSPMQSAPFKMELPTTGQEVRFDLLFEYQAPNQGGGESGSLQDGTPRVLLAATPPFLLAQATNPFLVRDACAGTMHRAQ